MIHEKCNQSKDTRMEKNTWNTEHKLAINVPCCRACGRRPRAADLPPLTLTMRKLSIHSSPLGPVLESHEHVPGEIRDRESHRPRSSDAAWGRAGCRRGAPATGGPSRTSSPRVVGDLVVGNPLSGLAPGVMSGQVSLISSERNQMRSATRRP